MKRVLITGKDSYIGTKVEEWLKKAGYEVNVLDVKSDVWKSYDFHGYDCVYHVAGIAHQRDVDDSLYERVNHLLAVEVAKTAANADVKQFIFMSSGAVYSQNDRNHKSIVVDIDSKLDPCTAYGKSKLRAEQDIVALESNMRIVIVRPPMVYGPGAKGNYNALSKFARTVPIIPKINNQRSMIYIDNLTEFIRLVIQSNSEGVFIPQNKEYINTTDLIKQIAKIHRRKVFAIGGAEWAVCLMGRLHDGVNKVFGSYIYEHPAIEYFNGLYQRVGYEESILLTETWNKSEG